MNRRILLAVFPLLAVAAFSFAPRTPADDKKKDDRDLMDHGPHVICAKACDDCRRLCDACSVHCAKLIADGKKDHLVTLQTCQDCATHCSAASAITARRGPFVDLICTACAEACKRCGDACDKHKHDDMMKKCAEECRKCEKACREMLKHTGQDHLGSK